MSSKDRRDFLKLGSVAGAGLILGAQAPAATADTRTEGTDETSDPPLDALTAIRKRRSVRSFQSTPIPDEHLKRILKAACLAPTSGNQQPWKFLVVKERANLDRLKEDCIAFRLEQAQADGALSADVLEQRRSLLERRLTAYLSAPVYVVVLTSGRSRYPDYNHWDGPLAVANLMIAARALGYGTVFCTDTIPEEVTRKTFAIPDDYTRVCITPIGVPETWPNRPAKLPWRRFVQKETFG